MKNIEILDNLKVQIPGTQSIITPKRVTVKNDNITIENISAQSPVLHQMYNQGKIDIMLAMYNVASGKVEFLILNSVQIS